MGYRISSLHFGHLAATLVVNPKTYLKKGERKATLL